MSIKTKILAVVLIVAFLGAIIGAAGFISIRRLSSASAELGQYSQQSDSFTSILNAHYGWRNGLTEAVLTGSEFTGSLDPTSCALGKWLSSEEAQNIDDLEIKGLLAEVVAPHNHIHREAEKVISHLAAEDRDAATSELTNNILPSFDEVIVDLLAIGGRYGELVNEKVAEVGALEKTTTIIIIAFIIAVFTVSVLLATFISGRIGRLLVPMTAFFQKAGETGDVEIREEDKGVIGKYIGTKDELGRLTAGAVAFIERVTAVSNAMNEVAAGDLTVELDLLSDRDVMGRAVNQMTENLSRMFGEIGSSAGQVSVGSRQVADGAQLLARGATEQAASIEELSSSVMEIAEKTRLNADMTGKAAELAEIIKSNAQDGSHHMDEMIAAVSEINDVSNSISKIISTIDDIAFQTNILALNAAVEAARAGQHGKGFAVVAEEVRSLADKSARAAKETSVMIEDSAGKAAAGAKIAAKTAESLAQIVSGLAESTELVGEIARASEEQSRAISQVNAGIDKVAQVVSQNSATAEESAAASEEMSGQSEVLTQLISQFKLKDSGVYAYNLPPRRAAGQCSLCWQYR